MAAKKSSRLKSGMKTGDVKCKPKSNGGKICFKKMANGALRITANPKKKGSGSSRKR